MEWNYPMMKTRYTKWQAFKFKGKEFLALTAKDGGGNTHIYNDNYDNYGAWFSVDSFKKHSAKDREKLNLDKLDTSRQEQK